MKEDKRRIKEDERRIKEDERGGLRQEIVKMCVFGTEYVYLTLFTLFTL